jgi:hypothetical protein
VFTKPKGDSGVNSKVARLDSKHDVEVIGWAKELRVTEAWFQSGRFRDITRLHTPFEVVALRANLQDDYTVARAAAVRMY